MALNEATISGWIKTLEDGLKQIRQSVEQSGQKPWRAAAGETYWKINEYGTVIEDVRSESEGCEKFSSYEYGNAFKTKEQAKAHRNRRRAVQTLQLIADELNGGTLLNGALFYLHTGMSREKVAVGSFSYSASVGTVGFKDASRAQKAFELLPDAHKMELFGTTQKSW